MYLCIYYPAFSSESLLSRLAAIYYVYLISNICRVVYYALNHYGYDYTYDLSLTVCLHYSTVRHMSRFCGTEKHCYKSNEIVLDDFPLLYEWRSQLYPTAFYSTHLLMIVSKNCQCTGILISSIFPSN